MIIPKVDLVDVKNNRFLLFNTYDLISEAVKRNIFCEVNQIAILVSEKIENSMILDVGSNLGSFCIPIANQIRSNKIICFEAQRIIFLQLCGNIFLNSLSNIFPNNLAVGSKCCQLEIPTFDYSKITNIGAVSLLKEIREYQKTACLEEKEKVEMVTLDSLSFERPCHLIKVDVEGFELEVLKGGLNFIESNNFPPIIFEEWKTERFGGLSKKIENKQKELRKFLFYMGYEEVVEFSENVFVQNPKHPIRLKKYKDGEKTHLIREN